MTVEAVFVFVSLLIIIFAVIYAMFLIYQNIVLLNAATVAAQEASYVISSAEKESLSESDIKSIVKRELNRGFFNSDTVKISVSQSGLFIKKVRVDLTYKIGFPMRSIAEMIAGEDVMTFNISSVARASNRGQTIRTIDLILEGGKRLVNQASSLTFGIFEGLLAGE